MSGSFVEGVDNEVVISFVVLVAVICITIIYYFKSSGNAFPNFSQYFGPRSEADVNEQPQRPDAAATATQQQNYGIRNSSFENREDRQNVPLSTGLSENTEHSSDSGSSSGSSTQNIYHDGVRRRMGGDYVSVTTPQGSHGPGLGGQPDNSSSRISIRVKHHEDERNIGVEPNITVGQLKRLCFPDAVAQGRRVRLIFSGRLLQDDNASISFYGVNDFAVIHAQISEVSEPEHHTNDVEVELDISRLLIPLLTVILAVCWYGLLSYRKLFNATSTIILIVITAAYGFMVYVMLG